jgi:hypothetical protein
MSDKNDNIISKDSNINQKVYEILNEAYHEFKQMYGDKHSNHIKELLENITDKVSEADKYYFGPIAAANAQSGVTYTNSDKLSAVLKHEMWHVYNNSASDREKSLQYIPQRYMDKLEQNGYLKEVYNSKMEDYKERYKDEPERLETLLIDYEKFKNNKFDFEDCPVEMWTEWFNCKTHTKDMNENFWDWGDGYFTKILSSASFYDSYINIASMISCIIPTEKLLEMYLQTGEYKTDYSYPEMLEEFDQKYENALDDEEKNKYQYPYLKILTDTKMISDNARKNPKVALETLQSCMKTCFNVYLQKLENTKDIDIVKAKEIYSEIKYMQENMVWNIDISKIKGFDYIQSLNNVQDKFKSMLQELDLKNPDVKQMLENIDYTVDNPFRFIEDGEKISEKILSTQKENKNNLVSVNGNYKAAVGKNGIKDNVYSSLFTLIGEKKYNLLYEKFQDNNLLDTDNNILLDFHKQIEKATTDEEIIDIYDNIYELYNKKIDGNLKINENCESEFNRYSKEIVELQKNGLFDAENKRYIPKLEKIINTYNEKVQTYEKEIDRITENDIQKYIKGGKTREVAENFAQRIPNIYKLRLNEQQGRIDEQRKQQVSQYTELNKKDFETYEHNSEQISYSISTQQIGKATINVPTSDKMKANTVVQKELTRDTTERSK